MKQPFFSQGFTLAELMIAVVILGVIAAISIPKIILVNKNHTKKVKILDAMAAISTAHTILQSEGQLTSATSLDDLLQKVNISSTISDGSFLGAMSSNVGSVYYIFCNGTDWICKKLPTGVVIFYSPAARIFDGTSSLNGIRMYITPQIPLEDGQTAMPVIYFNGRITTRAHELPGSIFMWDGCLIDTQDPAYMNDN